MDDLELLMMAAKAIGRKVKRIDGDFRTLCGLFFEDHESDDYSWNPLTDDGDALRLAVKLGMQVTPGTYLTHDAVAYVPGTHEVKEFVTFRKDMLAATRRAIVRTAAEIGKAMQNG